MELLCTPEKQKGHLDCKEHSGRQECSCSPASFTYQSDSLWFQAFSAQAHWFSPFSEYLVLHSPFKWWQESWQLGKELQFVALAGFHPLFPHLQLAYYQQITTKDDCPTGVWPQLHRCTNSGCVMAALLTLMSVVCTALSAAVVMVLVLVSSVWKQFGFSQVGCNLLDTCLYQRYGPSLTIVVWGSLSPHMTSNPMT